jgi:tagaturonate reductase
MNDPQLRAGIETVWEEEVLPVFAAMQQHDQAKQYIGTVRERFMNPYLDHRIADIAQNHAEKVKRRILPLIELTDSLSVKAGQPRLRSILAGHGLVSHTRV